MGGGILSKSITKKDEINETYIFLYPEFSYNLCTISYRLVSTETVNAINQYTVQSTDSTHDVEMVIKRFFYQSLCYIIVIFQ